MTDERKLEKMLDSSIAKNALKKYAEAGIEIVKFENEKKKLYITVPQTSDGELAGEELAADVKEGLRIGPFASYRVLYKIREEHWSKDKAKEAHEKLKQQLATAIKEQEAKKILNSY